MAEIKNIVFDVGGVFINGDPYALLKKFFKTREEMTVFLKEIDHDKMSISWDSGTPFKTVIDETIKKFPHHKEILLDLLNNWIEMIPNEIEGTFDLMLSLKKAGYKMFGLSNFAREKFDEMSAKFGFAKHFDGLIVSSDVGLIKPNAEIYQLFLSKHNLKANECVFLDDMPQNIDGAKKVGMNAIVFKDSAQAKKDLEKIGVKGA